MAKSTLDTVMSLFDYFWKFNMVKKGVPVYDPDSEEAKMDKPIPIIIGSAFGRTGTSSLKAGLSVLGYKCYHMKETMKKDNKGHSKVWAYLYAEKLKLKESKNIKSFKEWDQIKLDINEYGKYFELLLDDRGYTASVDWPSSTFYMEIMDYYDQKGIKYGVILSVRDNGQVWAKSFLNTIGKFPDLMNTWFWRLMPGMKEFIEHTDNKLQFDGKRLEKEYIIQKYDEWVESVKAYVDKDKLLVYNVKQGWKPLVNFLELDIPKQYADKPDNFIRTNDSKEMLKNINTLARVNTMINLVVSALITGIVAYVGYRMYDA